MIIRYGENEHGAIDSEIIVQICKPSKCTIIYDKYNNMHIWETTQFEHEYLIKKWIDSKKLKAEDAKSLSSESDDEKVKAY